MTDYRYGLARPDDIAGKTGREILQAIVDGHLPQAPISETMSFWIVAVGEGFAAFEGESSGLRIATAPRRARRCSC